MSIKEKIELLKGCDDFYCFDLDFLKKIFRNEKKLISYFKEKGRRHRTS